MAACFPKKHWCISVLILVIALAASCYSAKPDKNAADQNTIKKAENMMNIITLPVENPNKNTQAVSTIKTVPVNAVLQVKPRFTGRKRRKHYRKVMKFTRRKNEKKQWNRIRPNRKRKRPIKITKNDIKTQEIGDKLKLQHIDPVVNELPKGNGFKKSKPLKKKRKGRKVKSLSDVVEALTKKHKKGSGDPLSTDAIRKMLSKPNKWLSKRKQKQRKLKTEIKTTKPIKKKKIDGKLKSLSDVVKALTKEHKKGSEDPLSTDAIRKMLMKTNKRLNRRKQKQGKPTKLTLKNFPMKKNKKKKNDKPLNKSLPKKKLNLRPKLKGSRRRQPRKGTRRRFRPRLRNLKRGQIRRRCFKTKKGKVCKRVRTFGKGRRRMIANRRRLLARQRLRALKLGKRRQLGIHRNTPKAKAVIKQAKKIANKLSKAMKEKKKRQPKKLNLRLKLKGSRGRKPRKIKRRKLTPRLRSLRGRFQRRCFKTKKGKICKRVRTFGKGRRNKIANRRKLLARQRLRALKLGKRRQFGINRNAPKANASIKQAKKVANIGNKLSKAKQERKTMEH